jgi:hypothetical protein
MAADMAVKPFPVAEQFASRLKAGLFQIRRKQAVCIIGQQHLGIKIAGVAEYRTWQQFNLRQRKFVQIK